MPIDFAAVAALYTEAFARQLKNVTTAQQFIEKALGRRRDAARLVDRATETFPIVRFYNGAVSLVLTNPHNSLTSVLPEVSFGEHLRRGGRGFVDGLGRAVDPLRGTSQETVILRFLTGLRDAVKEIEASVHRFAVPGKEMFDPSKRTASDLFGLAALGFRALGEAATTSGELKRLTDQIRATMAVVKTPVPAGGSTMDVPAPPASSVRSTVETMDALVFETLGGIVIVGALPQLVEDMLTGLLLGLKDKLLTEFASIEREVLDLRATAFETIFAGATGIAGRGVLLIAGAYQLINANVMYQLKFARAFGTQFAVGIRDFVVGLGGFLQDIVTLLKWVPSLLEAITDFDAGYLVGPKLGWISDLLVGVSLGNLLDDAGFHTNHWLRDKMTGIIDLAEKAAESKLAKPFDWFTDWIDYVRRQIARARRLVAALFDGGGGGTAISVPPEGAPLRFHSDFPDLAKTLFGGGRREQIVAAVTRLERAARKGVDTALRRTSLGMEQLATGMTAEAVRAAGFASDRRLAGLGAQADALADGVFGPEVAAQRRKVTDRPEDALAKAFESWLATTTADGGFLLIGEAIPRYAAEVARHWRAQLAEGTELTAELTPTSPHILRKRATLGKVAMPRLTLHAAPGRVLDEEFADVVAGQFAQAVREAYQTGQRRLRALAEIGGK